MSLRDEREEFEKWYVGRFPNALLYREGESYYFAGPRGAWEVWQPAYQSATERALRIGLDVHAWASARNLNWSTVLTEYERRIKGDKP